jgi:hypothetical protein
VTPLVRVLDDLRTNAIANLAIGDIGLLAAAIRSDHPGRAVVLFAIVNVVLAVIWGGFGPASRLRREAPRASTPPEWHSIEPPNVTRRRVLVGLAPVVLVLAVVIVVAPESAAVLAGVPAGIGAGELWLLGWARRYQDDNSEELLRDVPASPFTGGKRTVYTRPMNEATDAT